MVDEYLENLDSCFKIFKIVGIYRPKGVYVGHRIYGFISRLILIDIFLILQTIYFYRVKNIIDFADLVSMQLTYVAIAAKSYYVIHNFDTVVEVVSELRELLIFASEYQMNFGVFIEKRMKNIRKVFLIYWSTCPTSITLAFVIAMKDAQFPPFMTQYKIYSPSFFNFEENYFYFVITEIYAYISANFASTSAVAMDFLAVFFFSMGAGLLEELADRIEFIETELSDKKAAGHDDRTIDELNKCIIIHAKIKKFLTAAQNFVSLIIFIQVVISTAVICMTCYTISMVSLYFVVHAFLNFFSSEKFSPADGGSVFFRQITYMIPMGLQIFIPCYYGNEIMIAAEKFSMDIFHSKWYNGCKKFRTAFNTLLIHASQPLIMISGILFQVTLENFVAVSRLSYKFYAVMQNMNAKDINK